MKSIFAIAIAIALATVPLSFAQNAAERNAHHPNGADTELMPNKASPPSSSSKIEVKEPMVGMQMTMKKSMDDMPMKMMEMRMTGDFDIDFAMMMVAHHQGAVKMAQGEIDSGKDPAMVKLAKQIMAAQKKEIAQFELLLKKHPRTMK